VGLKSPEFQGFGIIKLPQKTRLNGSIDLKERSYKFYILKENSSGKGLDCRAGEDVIPGNIIVFYLFFTLYLQNSSQYILLKAGN
jgi:hypothetical protein